MDIKRGWKARRDKASRRSEDEAKRHDVRRQRALLAGLVVDGAEEPVAEEAAVEEATVTEDKPARKGKA